MSEQTPKHILCAVRSRPGGEETVNRAIDLALEANARLTFFQVIGTSFVNRFSARGSSRKAAYRELLDMAEFTLSMLCEQAQKRGVEQVDYILRQGQVREELLRVVTETCADMLVMGRPKRGPGRSEFKNRELDKFIAELEQTGIVIDQ